MHQSNTHKFHYKLDVQYFSTYYVKLLHVSAIYPGHLQGVTCLVDVYSIYGNLSHITGRLDTYTYILYNVMIIQG
jgi:hypothetical protein